MRTFIVLALLSCIVGCGFPMTEKPLGERWKKNEVSEFDGWWYFVDEDKNKVEPFVIRSKKLGRGEAFLGSLRYDNEDAGFVGSSDLWTFTHLGKYDLVFIREDGERDDLEPDRKGAFYFGLIREKNKDMISFAVPRQEPFLALVKQRKLAGEIKDAENEKTSWALITSDADEFLKTIEDAGIEKCFEMDKVLTMKRIKRSDQ